MTLLDYSTHNYYLSNQINYNNINPFDQQQQKFESFINYDAEFPSEAELLCFDPLPPSLFDFDLVDFQVPHFNPPPPPTITPLNYNDFIIPDYYAPCIEECTDILPQYSFGFDEEFIIPDNRGVLPCGFDQSNCDYNIDYNVGVIGGGVKKVTAQSKAARERRRKITQKTQDLGKLVPGGNKMNTAEMFQAAAKYVMFLQAQLGILKTIESLNEEGDKNANFSDSLPILKSHLIQGKLYKKEKCLVPVNFLPTLKKHMNFDPSILKEINELMH